ncbi:TrbI/VirB10 family protein, partial [Vibrio lentus]
STSPVLFEMLNGGFLPNGKHTKLKGCTMTGSAYGDISSSRGIVRGDRLSCVRKDGSVLDIPVEATVFNYGKNGIAGTAIMRNSKIIQSAGIAGGLGRIGERGDGNVTNTIGISARLYDVR